MLNKILVTYATRHGSTAGVAEAIGKALTERGAVVDVLPMTDVHNLAPYRAIVAGSAINGGEWLPEAMQFVRAYQTELQQKPFAAFLVCMTLTMQNGAYREHVANWLAPVRALVPSVSEGLFTGAFQLSKVTSFGDRLKFRIAMMTGFWREGDHRDWNAIRTWAENIYPALK